MEYFRSSFASLILRHQTVRKRKKETRVVLHKFHFFLTHKHKPARASCSCRIYLYCIEVSSSNLTFTNSHISFCVKFPELILRETHLTEVGFLNLHFFLFNVSKICFWDCPYCILVLRLCFHCFHFWVLLCLIIFILHVWDILNLVFSYFNHF